MARSSKQPKEASVHDAFPPIAFNVREAARSMGISRSYVYRLIESGELYSRRVGRRILIPRKAVEAFMEGRAFVAGGNS